MDIRNSLEKETYQHDEGIENGEKDLINDVVYDEKETKRILRKIDIRILPVLTLLYLMAFLDRGNIGNAKVAGMNDTLRLTDLQYNLCLTIFFFPYSLFEVPSNIMLKLLRPVVWLPIIVLCWGTVMTLMGIVQSYRGLLAARFFLGFTESGLFPAASFLLTTWYCRYELQTRVAGFYSAASLSGAFSGLLAFAIQKMEGVAGLEGWRWIFIIEGLVTVLTGIILPFILIDSPENAKFLSEQERQFIIKRLQADYSQSSKESTPFKWKYLREALLDWKIYLSVVIFWGNTIPGYGFVFTLPTVIKGLGYSAANAQLLTIPVYVLGMIVTLSSAIYADRARKRSNIIIYPYILCATGFIILMALPKEKWPGARYAMLFVVAAGLYPPLCGVVAWNANNLAGSWKRAIGMGLQLTVGNLGGAVGSNIYLAREAPYYWTGFGVSLALLIAAIVAAVILHFSLKHVNKKRDQISEEEIRSRYTAEELTEMGDSSPLFRYTL